MQLNISGHHVEVTPALKSYVEEKLTKLERHFNHITQVHVTLSVEKLSQIAEAVVHLAGKEIFAKQTSNDMYASIDGLVDKLDRQVVKHKEKLKDHHGDHGSSKG